MNYQALYRQWRPRTFAEVLGQEHITRTLRNAVAAGQLSHAYLFCGPRGTGKTSTAKILARAANCTAAQGGEPCNACPSCQGVLQGTGIDLVEIDAASNRGIDEIRDLRERVGLAPALARFRVYIIDEVHMLTTEAFNALLKTLEEPPAHALFILATTEPQRLPLTVLSRCQRFDFRRLEAERIAGHLAAICREVGREATPAALNLIARAAAGGMRDALSLLDQCLAYGDERVGEEEVAALVGLLDNQWLEEMAGALAEGKTVAVLELVQGALTAGRDVRQLVQGLSQHLRNLLLVSLLPEPGPLLELPPEAMQPLVEQAKLWDGIKRLSGLVDALCSLENDLRWSEQPRLLLEMALLGACQPQAETVRGELEQRVERLEKMLAGGGGNSAQGRRREEAGPPALAPVPRTAAPGSAPPAGKTAAAREEVSRPAQPVAAKPAPPAGKAAMAQEELPARWEELLRALRKARVTTHALLKVGKPLSCRDGVLTLAFPEGFTFHRERMEQHSEQEAVAAAWHKLFGEQVKVRTVLEEPAGKEQPSAEAALPGSPDPLVQAAIDIFGGEVVEVKE